MNCAMPICNKNSPQKRVEQSAIFVGNVMNRLVYPIPMNRDKKATSD